MPPCTVRCKAVEFTMYVDLIWCAITVEIPPCVERCKVATSSTLSHASNNHFAMQYLWWYYRLWGPLWEWGLDVHGDYMHSAGRWFELAICECMGYIELSYHACLKSFSLTISIRLSWHTNTTCYYHICQNISKIHGIYAFIKPEYCEASLEEWFECPIITIRSV